MLNDLDETLKQLLVQKGGLDPAEVDISFDIPTRDWSTPVTRPTVNLYLFDMRENLQLRETHWDQEDGGNGRAKLTRRPVRIDLSYMITCWTSAAEDQHRLLWRVLETFFRYSPLPDEILQGSVRQAYHPVRTLVAQPDGILKNVSDFWGALENQLRPSISLVITLDLDLNQITLVPLTFARVLKMGERDIAREPDELGTPPQRLGRGWEAARTKLAGRVRTGDDQPIPGASVRLVTTQPDGGETQFGPSVETDAAGRYVFPGVPPGEYTLVVEVAGQKSQRHPLTVAVADRGEPLPEMVHEVEVLMNG